MSSRLEKFQNLTLPEGSAGAYRDAAQLTSAERRTFAISALENPVVCWVLVDAYQQAVQTLRLGLPGADVAHQCSVLRVIDQLIGALVGEAAEAREFPSGE